MENPTKVRCCLLIWQRAESAKRCESNAETHCYLESEKEASNNSDWEAKRKYSGVFSRLACRILFMLEHV